MKGYTGSMLYRFCLLPPGPAVPWPAPPGPLTLPLQGGQPEAQRLWGVGGHPWKLRCAECPLNSEGENQMEERSSFLPPPAKTWVQEHLLTPGLAQTWRVLIPDGWGCP